MSSSRLVILFSSLLQVISLAGREGIEWCEENSGTILLRLDGMKEYNFVEDDKESDED